MPQDIQQNLRDALYLLERELRRRGASERAGIVSAMLAALDDGRIADVAVQWAEMRHEWWDDAWQADDHRLEAVILSVSAVIANMLEQECTGSIPPPIDVSQEAIQGFATLSEAMRTKQPPTNPGVSLPTKRVALFLAGLMALCAGVLLVAIARRTNQPLIVCAVGIGFLIWGCVYIIRGIAGGRRSVESQFNEMIRKL